MNLSILYGKYPNVFYLLPFTSITIWLRSEREPRLKYETDIPGQQLHCPELGVNDFV